MRSFRLALLNLIMICSSFHEENFRGIPRRGGDCVYYSIVRGRCTGVFGFSVQKRRLYAYSLPQDGWFSGHYDAMNIHTTSPHCADTYSPVSPGYIFYQSVFTCSQGKKYGPLDWLLSLSASVSTQTRLSRIVFSDRIFRERSFLFPLIGYHIFARKSRRNGV